MIQSIAAYLSKKNWAWSIRRRVVVTIATFFFVTSLSMVIFAYNNRWMELESDVREDVNETLQDFHYMLQVESVGLDKLHSGLVQNVEIIQYFAERHLEKLQNSVAPVFAQMKSDFSVTHLYFIEPDGRVFLRAHKNERGDIIHRNTFLRASLARKKSSGIEMGRNFFSLRNIHPVDWKGEFTGFIELG
ncbi:MAG: hypothetical protein HQL73_02020 [Magnetococcales bacterium]|nr:hypothetical protein [Magnetococcales bacterium]